jgi:hypothetical protein
MMKGILIGAKAFIPATIKTVTPMAAKTAIAGTTIYFIPEAITKITDAVKVEKQKLAVSMMGIRIGLILIAPLSFIGSGLIDNQTYGTAVKAGL